MSIAASPDTMAWAREHIPESIIDGMVKDGFLIVETTKETEKNE